MKSNSEAEDSLLVNLKQLGAVGVDLQVKGLMFKICFNITCHIRTEFPSDLSFQVF